MILVCLQTLTAWLLFSLCSAATTSRYESYFHQHSGSDLDHVQCHHTVYKISPNGGTPELVNGQESRVEPSRQYLPQPSIQKEAESPAASFEQPNILSVDKSFISPPLQNNYNSLFSQKKQQDNLFPSAAQNVPANAFPPAAPRITSDKKHSHEDDENNLERLCSDAFHSFLCKPITGPRKTPTGRLRPNAVIPLDILAGLSSSLDGRRVRPDIPETPSASNTVGQKYLPPTQPEPSNKVPQNAPFLKLTTTSTKRTPTAYLPPAPFENILKNEKSDGPEVPSSSNTNSQVIKPKPPHDCEKAMSLQSPVVGSPSNDNSLFVKAYSPSTPKPFSNYFNNAPSTSFPTNNFPKFNQPLRSIVPPHDCNKSSPNSASLVANPSNDNPLLIKPYNVPTQKPFFDYRKATTPIPTTNFNKLPQYTQPLSYHDCDKSKQQLPSFVADPTNNNPEIIKPSGFSTQTKPPATFSTRPSFSYFSRDFSKSASTTQEKLIQPSSHDDCDKHKSSVFGAKTLNNPVTPKPFSQTTPNQFFRLSTESQKQSLHSNNIPQIIAQPQQINTVTISPKGRGYFYDKPDIPFQIGSPSFQNANIQQLPTQSSPTKKGYNYDQPRIPFPSDNIAQIVSQPPQQIPTFRGFTTSTAAPCEHHSAHSSSSSVVGNPTNEDLVMINPNSYIYNKPDVPFPPERTGSSNQNLVSLRPAETSTGYSYDKPENPFLLPNPTNNSPKIVASPANNGYSYDIPERKFPLQTNLASSNNVIFSNAPLTSSTPRPYTSESKGYSYEQPKESFPTSINSKLSLVSDTSNFVAKPQNQVEVKVRPGYSYEKPSELFETPQASSDNQNIGYAYPKPASSFKR